MSEITISIPEDSISALHVPVDRAGDELRMLAAAKLFELKRLSSGAAARLAGVPRTVFLQRLGDYGIPVLDLTKEELRQETRLV